MDIGVGIVNATCVLPRTVVGKPLRELPRVTYFALTRPRPRAAVEEVLNALRTSSFNAGRLPSAAVRNVT